MSHGKISVSWVSVNNDPFSRDHTPVSNQHEPGPTLEFLLNEASPLRDRIDKHYILVRRQHTPKVDEPSPSAEEVAEKLMQEIGKRDGPPVECKFWVTDEAPTNHQALFRFTASTLAEIRRNHPTEQIVVNLSPGTPAAQTVMLLALQARVAGDNVLAYQGIPRKHRQDTQVLEEVPWNLLAELGRRYHDHVADERWSITKARTPSLRKVAELVQRYGRVPFPVLIIGNRGSGKTHIAESLREVYRDWKVRLKNGWNHHLNCAEFRGDPMMLRSSLFGYVKGAHSTAGKNSLGLLEQAGDDCVFLDEIHWMDPQAQGMLLLALQRNGSFRQIGGEKPIASKFRLIAATNKSRRELREVLAPDFLDRISELIIELPDLRDCRTDLEDIWKDVVYQACDELAQLDPERVVGQDKMKMSLTRDYADQFRPHQSQIVRALQSMQLPGNYRDLERLARRLLVGGLQTGRLLSIGPEQVNQELDNLRREESLDDERRLVSPGSLQDELPTISRCVSYLREAQVTDTCLPCRELVEEWERRLLVAAQKVAGSGTKAAAFADGFEHAQGFELHGSPCNLK